MKSLTRALVLAALLSVYPVVASGAGTGAAAAVWVVLGTVSVLVLRHVDTVAGAADPRNHAS